MEQIPTDLQKGITAYLHKEIPAYCQITEEKDDVIYEIWRNNKRRFYCKFMLNKLTTYYTTNVTNFTIYSQEEYVNKKEVEARLCHVDGDVKLKIVNEKKSDEMQIILVTSEGREIPRVGFSFQHYKKAFDTFLLDIERRIEEEWAKRN